MKLLFLGHASFRLTTSSAVIYIDPYKKGDYSIPADLVLITHEHYDHNRTELITLKKDGIIRRAADFELFKPISLKGVTVTAVPAFNKNHSVGCVGYVVEADGKKLYFAGDTSKTDYMGRLNDIDYAFLPTDGIFNMDAIEATKCAEIIGAIHSVAIHTERPEEEYNEAVAAKFTPRGKLELRPKEEIEL